MVSSWMVFWDGMTEAIPYDDIWRHKGVNLFPTPSLVHLFLRDLILKYWPLETTSAEIYKSTMYLIKSPFILGFNSACIRFRFDWNWRQGGGEKVCTSERLNINFIHLYNCASGKESWREIYMFSSLILICIFKFIPPQPYHTFSLRW